MHRRSFLAGIASLVTAPSSCPEPAQMESRAQRMSGSHAWVFGVVLMTASVASWPATATADPGPDDPAAARLDPDYAAGRHAIDTRDWGIALTRLSAAALRDTSNADIQNYLGYAYRQRGQLELAFKHYKWALQLNPRHRGAHEYVGEAYLMVNDLTKAEEHLAALETICLVPCEEYEDLRKAITEYRQRAAK